MPRVVRFASITFIVFTSSFACASKTEPKVASDAPPAASSPTPATQASGEARADASSTSPQALCKHLKALDRPPVGTNEAARYQAKWADCERVLKQVQTEYSDQYPCFAQCVLEVKQLEDPERCARSCKLSKPLPADHHIDAEATRNLQSIETALKYQFQKETDTSADGDGTGPFVHTFCPSASVPVPAEIASAGERVTPDPEAWNTPSWQCLKFASTSPLYFQYEYYMNGKWAADARYTVTARRRLANGKIRVFRLEGGGTSMGEASRHSMKIFDQ